VFVLIPLLPGFEGDVTDSATLKLILKYTYKTISRNRGFSLIEKLYQLMQDKYEDYIQFFSLRTHTLIQDVPMTELIYIHSKTMVVDDEVAMIGSANINDRSMLGNRDTEIAVIIKELNDENKKISMMDGKRYLACEFVHSLRIRLFREYLGISTKEYETNHGIKNLLNDPLSDKLFKFMKEIARSNTMYYREIFNTYPDDNFLSYSDILWAKEINNWESNENTLMKYQKNKNKIVGFIVEFPLNFLREENLKISYFCKEILVPIKNFL